MFQYGSIWKAYTNWARLIDMGNGADVDNIVFAHIGTTDRIAVSIKDTPGGSSEDHHQNGAATLNKWTHIAFTVTDSPTNTARYKIYRDGSYLGQSGNDKTMPVSKVAPSNGLAVRTGMMHITMENWMI